MVECVCPSITLNYGKRVADKTNSTLEPIITIKVNCDYYLHIPLQYVKVLLSADL